MTGDDLIMLRIGLTNKLRDYRSMHFPIAYSTNQNIETIIMHRVFEHIQICLEEFLVSEAGRVMAEEESAQMARDAAANTPGRGFEV